MGNGSGNAAACGKGQRWRKKPPVERFSRGGLAMAGAWGDRRARMGVSRARPGRDAHAVHRRLGRRTVDPGRRAADHRRPPDRRPVHAERSVLHDAALRPPQRGRGRVPPARFRPGRHAARAVDGRPARHAEPRPGLRLRVLGKPRPAERPVEQRPLDRRLAAHGAAAGGRAGRGARVRLLRRRPRRGGSALARPDLHCRPAIRPQPRAGSGALGRAAPRLRAERRAPLRAPGPSVAAAGPRLVRRAERQVGRRDQRAEGSVPRPLAGPLVPHAEGRDDSTARRSGSRRPSRR